MTASAADRYDDLLARAATTVDTLDDIDEMASIGGPMDELADLTRSMTLVEAVREATATGTNLFRIANILDEPTTHGWRLDWLRRTTGCSDRAAETIAATTAQRVLDTADPVLANLGTLLDQADLTARRLEAILATHPSASAAVPDTIPEEWTR